jgi:cell division protein FtsQ
MRLSFRKQAAREIGPRVNQWKGARASEIADQRQQARRERLVSRGRYAVRVGRWIVGLAALVWGVTIVTQEMGPVLQSWLEIREVEVEGIHRVTKGEVLERLVLKPGLGLHQVSTSFLAERVRTLPWIKEAAVERRPPHLLYVAVVERMPAVVVRSGADHWLSDESGYLLTHLGRQDDRTLPLLTGVNPQSLQRGEAGGRNAVQSGVVLARLITATFDGRVEIDLANPANVVASADGVRFQFGDDSLVDQWERFQKVRPSFKPALLDGRKREVNEIDLRYDNRVIVREGA